MTRLWLFELCLVGCGAVVMSVTSIATISSRAVAGRRHAVLTLGPAAAIALAMLAYLVLVVEPAFVHPEFYGPELITDILLFPSRVPAHREYGAGSFAILRALSAAFGRSAEAVVRANEIFAAACTIPLAALAMRWSGRPSAGIYAALAWASSGLVARVGASEDVHMAVTFVALSTALAIDIAATTGAWPVLVAAVAGGQIIAVSRQSFFAWIPMFLLLWWERSRPADAVGAGCSPRLRRAGLVAMASVPLSTAALLLLRDAAHAQIILMADLLLLKNPSEMWSCIVEHPVFDVRRLSILLPLLTALGAVWILRRSPARWSWIVGAALSAFLSAPTNWPSPGNRWAFRLPVYVLALIAAGIGATCIEERVLRSASPRRRVALVGTIGAVIVACGLLAPASREGRVTHAEFQNYVFLRNTLERLRGEAQIGLILPPDEAKPRNAAKALSQLMEIRIVEARKALAGPVDPQVSWYFYRDLACFAWSVPELILPPGAEEAEMTRWILEDEDRLLTLLFRADEDFGFARIVHRDWTEHPHCKELAAHSDSVGLSGPHLVPQQDPPQIVYLVPSVTPELRRWIGTRGAGESAPVPPP
ncbi:hypothetical protein [Polyangium aurulentum]|uniref:hypothetical protein n=1 Tax=Polyangium aurulentum TaxID=2567896 RepID=UPI0010AE9EEE|nr:hypothetical protein [Polyangium aurulentum]UQA60394.1 hypothetical protein E8A73_007945 [Polyangium aurulentum]